MAEYYRTRPPVTASVASTLIAPTPLLASMSEFDRHRETLISDDLEEGWASELRRYLSTMQRNVKKDTDIVEWWQVSVYLRLHLI